MKETISAILDLLSWVIVGTLMGFSVLGGLYIFNLRHQSVTPNLTIKPLEQTKSKTRTSEKSFQPASEFFLVQKYSQPEEEETEKPDKVPTESTQPDTPQDRSPTGDEGLVMSNLPYKLLGTVTGGKQFQFARLQNLRKRKSRTLRIGDTWGSIKIEDIQDDKIIIINNEKNRREKILLKKPDNGSRS
ncbi:MAG: hypothetical protein ABEK50_17750 [bacterium]